MEIFFNIWPRDLKLILVGSKSVWTCAEDGDLDEVIYQIENGFDVNTKKGISIQVNYIFDQKLHQEDIRKWAVVVAQLVEQLLPTPEIWGSNPNIGKILSTNCTFKKKRQR